MSPRTATPIALLLPLTLAAASVTAQGRDAPVPPFDRAVVHRYAERLLRDARVPAAALAIVRDGRIVYLRGFGADVDGRPVTGHTSFVLGSMSKPITALAVMQLVEQRRIGLDVPVRHYLPDFRLATSDSGRSVTVRHLLLHTSGIPHGATRGTGTRSSLRARVAALRSVVPESPAGAAHAYASPNYLVLGAIVEAASGESFAAYVERAIFAPLSMHDSFTARARARENRFAGGNVYVLGFPVPSSLPEELDRLPTAGLMSSAGDLANFLVMQLQHGRLDDVQVLGSELVEQMHTGAAPSAGFSYAFGWREGTIAGTRAVHHGGVLPDFRGKMVMLPDSGWGVVVLTNASSAVPWPVTPVSHRLADDIAAYLAGRPFPPPTSRHRLFFGAVAAGMVLLAMMQARALRRALNGARAASAAGRRARTVTWANATDIFFVVFVASLPRVVGLTWPDLLRGAPDVGWWLLVLAGLGTVTVAARLAPGRWRA